MKVFKIKDIINIWDSLYKKKNSDGEIIKGVYDVMAKYMEDFGIVQKKHIILMDQNIREYFRFIKYENIEIKNYCDITEMKKKDYYYQLTKLNLTKET